MSGQPCRDWVPTTPRGSHGTQERDINQGPERSDGLAVVPARMVHELSDQFNGRLGSVGFKSGHVEVVNEEDGIFAQRRAKDSFASAKPGESLELLALQFQKHLTTN